MFIVWILVATGNAEAARAARVWRRDMCMTSETETSRVHEIMRIDRAFDLGEEAACRRVETFIVPVGPPDLEMRRAMIVEQVDQCLFQSPNERPCLGVGVVPG